MKKYLVLAAAVSAFIAAAGVQAGELKVGATPVPHAEVLEFVKPIVAKQGVDLTIIEFNDYVQPNLATDDGQLDANYFQHRPYLQSFIDERGCKLIEVGGVHIEPMAIYSHKIKDLKELGDGATVAIPNDPTNGGRALLLLASAGIISLEDPTNVTATVLAIKDNPKNLKFQELEAAQLPRSLDDVDISIINTNFAMQADLIPTRDALLIEGADSPKVNILIANPEAIKNTARKIQMDAMQSPETKKFIEDTYKGAVLAAF